METVETRFGCLDFPTEPLDEVFTDNAVRCCEGCEDVRDKMTLIAVDAFLPIMERSISPSVQKLTSVFLYISHISWYWMGKRTNDVKTPSKKAHPSHPSRLCQQNAS